MPIYEYRCEDGHTFEVMQRMADDPVAVCEVCGKPVQRVFHPVAVHYKGSGFYSTDYGSKKGGGGDKESKKDDTSDKSEKSEKSEKTEKSEGSSDSKSETKSEKKGSTNKKASKNGE